MPFIERITSRSLTLENDPQFAECEYGCLDLQGVGRLLAVLRGESTSEECGDKVKIYKSKDCHILEIGESRDELSQNDLYIFRCAMEQACLKILQL